MIFGRTSLSVAFKTATVYDISRIDVDKGESFVLTLTGIKHKLRWFSDNDPVLEIAESKDTHSATIKASAVGRSVLFITSHGFVRKAIITVRKSNDGNATDLGVAFGTPTTK